MCARCDQMADRRKASIAPDLAAILAQNAASGLVTPDPAIVGITAAREVNEAYFRAICEPKAPVRSVSVVEVISTHGHKASVKVAVPVNVQQGGPAILYLHGGGYAFGDIDTHDHIIRALAAETGMAVFGLDYRRTPEHAYPAALEDAQAATAAMRSDEWIRRFGHDPARLLVVGDSAGAHLALTLMLVLRQGNEAQFAGAALIYGMYERRFDTWSHHSYGDGSQGLSSMRMRWFWDRLLEGHPGGLDPYAEPIHADLAGLPRLALFAAEVDCLLDDTLDLVEACKRQDQPHSFDLFRAMPHGFFHMASVYEGSHQAMALVAKRLHGMVG